MSGGAILVSADGKVLVSTGGKVLAGVCDDTLVRHVLDVPVLGGYFGPHTFHTRDAIQILLCQDDGDGSSLAWGVTATFTFTPDAGHPPITGFVLSASWAEHHTSILHKNCDCTDTFPDATGTWDCQWSFTGTDNFDVMHVSVLYCHISDCPTYGG